MSGGAGAWPNGLDLGSSGVGLRGFKSRPPHMPSQMASGRESPHKSSE